MHLEAPWVVVCTILQVLFMPLLVEDFKTLQVELELQYLEELTIGHQGIFPLPLVGDLMQVVLALLSGAIRQMLLFRLAPIIPSIFAHPVEHSFIQILL